MRTVNGSAIGVAALTGLLLICTSASVAVPEELPETITITGTIRDFPPENNHPDFMVNPSATPGARSAKNIQLSMDEELKPVYLGGGKKVNNEWRDAAGEKIAWCAPPLPDDNTGSFSSNDDGGITSAASFAQWWRDVPGVNMSRLWSIDLTKQADNSYEYSTNDFHPIDEQLFGNGPDEHNFYFTYEIVCNFTYHAADNPWIWFKGDDDCWIFIDNKLTIDHGGIASNREQRFELARLNLVDGQDYQLHFFMAERYQPQTQFHFRTNILMESVTPESVLAAYD